MAQVEIIAANLKTTVKNSIKKLLKRVCAYARVSTDSEEQLNSYESQIKHYSDYIKSNPEWEFVGIYADEGISGTQVKKRTEFQRMIEDALNGKIDIIIAKSISRFARNTVDTLNYVRLLREHNVDVYFEKENIHTLNLDSEMFLTLFSAFAQAESESISMNVKLGLKAIMKRGDCVGKARCYGYNWNKDTKKLTINEEEAKVVKQVFNWYIDGLGSSRIAKKLNEMNIPSPSGIKWQKQYIRLMITQEKYVGDLLCQKTYTISPLTHKRIRNYGEKEKYYVKDHHEPIISRDVWNKAQEILSKRSKVLTPTRDNHDSRYSMRYAFSSKIVCGLCGKSYVRRVGSKLSDGTRNVYWACNTRINDNINCKDSQFLKEKVLENMFIEIYNSMVKNKHKTKDKLIDAIKGVIKDNSNEIKLTKLNTEEDNIRKKISNLIDLKLENYIDKEAYIQKEKELKDQLDKIYEKKKEYENLEKEKKELSLKIKEIEKYLEMPTILKEFDKDVFNNIVEKIVVNEVSEDGTRNNNIVRFVLKTGVEFTKNIIKNMEENNGVSLGQENVVCI